MPSATLDRIASEGGELYAALCANREPMYEIAAKAPAPVVLCGDNIDAVLVNPRLFERYMMPVYKQQGRILHAQGKLMAVTSVTSSYCGDWTPARLSSSRVSVQISSPASR